MFNIPTWKIVFMKSTKDGYVEIARKKFNPKKQSVDFRGDTSMETGLASWLPAPTHTLISHPH